MADRVILEFCDEGEAPVTAPFEVGDEVEVEVSYPGGEDAREVDAKRRRSGSARPLLARRQRDARARCDRNRGRERLHPDQADEDAGRRPMTPEAKLQAAAKRVARQILGEPCDDYERGAVAVAAGQIQAEMETLLEEAMRDSARLDAVLANAHEIVCRIPGGIQCVDTRADCDRIVAAMTPTPQDEEESG